MMSQNSHEKGHPREYCTDILLYFFMLTSPKSAIGASDIGGRSVALYVRFAVPRSRSSKNCGNVVSASPWKMWSAYGSSSIVLVTYGPPSTIRFPRFRHR